MSVPSPTTSLTERLGAGFNDDDRSVGGRDQCYAGGDDLTARHFFERALLLECAATLAPLESPDHSPETTR